ncbi:MAG: hypothetical protein V4450_07450 [Bacteroidota bacterium]
MRKTKIAGVDLDLDQFDKHEKLADLKKNGHQVFDHLSGDEQKSAYEELWKKLNAKEAPAPGTEAANAAPSADEVK